MSIAVHIVIVLSPSPSWDYMNMWLASDIVRCSAGISALLSQEIKSDFVIWNILTQFIFKKERKGSMTCSLTRFNWITSYHQTAGLLAIHEALRNSTCSQDLISVCQGKMKRIVLHLVPCTMQYIWHNICNHTELQIGVQVAMYF